MVRFDSKLPLPWGDKGEMIGGTKMTAAAVAQREVAGACPKELKKEWEAWIEQQAADGRVPENSQPRRKKQQGSRWGNGLWKDHVSS